MEKNPTCDKPPCNQCVDVIHEFMGKHLTQYNHLGDVFVIFNAALLCLGVGMNMVQFRLLSRIFFIGVFLYMIRALCANITVCDADTNRTSRPMLSCDNVWYIISGHTMFSLLATYVITKSRTPSIVQFLSIVCCLFVMFFQSGTREHYTVDIVLTIIIVHLAIRAYA
jgi:hypothetical protein